MPPEEIRRRFPASVQQPDNQHDKDNNAKCGVSRCDKRSFRLRFAVFRIIKHHLLKTVFFDIRVFPLPTTETTRHKMSPQG